MAMAIALAASRLFRQFSTIYLLLLLMMSAGAKQQAQKHRFIIGSALNTSTSSKWISPSGEFAFGFYKVMPRLYLVGVWFDNISNKTLVWTANRDDGPVGEDSTLQLSSTGLQLSNSQSTVRRITELPGQSVSAAEMRDNGNFVLLNASKQPVWQSFDRPTDTLLPGQTIKSPYTLYARATNTNYSKGRFVLSFQKNGDLMLFPVERVGDRASHYWPTETATNGTGPSNLNFGTNGILSLVDASSNTTVWNATIWNNINTTEQFLGRVTLDADGILRGYVWKGDGDTSWIPQWRALEDPCQVKGQCGLNSICQGNQNSFACTCPPGFDFVDSDDPSKGCSRDPSKESCSDNSTMMPIGNIDWWGNDYGEMILNETECQQACIEDCMCVVVVYSAPDEFCWKKAMPLRDGKTGADRATFVKIVSEPSQSDLRPPKQKRQGEKKRKVKRMVILGFGMGLLVCSAIITTISLIIWLRGRRFQHKLAEGLLAFSYEELSTATGAFKHELGRGAFGEVYKGTLSDGRAVVVKKLKRAQQEGEKEFRTEISVIGASHHKNLVQLYGFCDEGCHRLLVYEFVSNGSLDRALFDSESYLYWKLRVQIALGIARGLLYLHEECRTQILHCDIKPQNILLDENYTAKISDFGMAKLIRAEQTRTFTAARGTIGYIAPEWQRNMAVTAKVDVYSFGVMLLEIICCRRMFMSDAPENEILLAQWIYDCLSARTLVKLVEQQQQAECDSEIDSKKLERIVLVGLWCIQEDPALRPSIKKVVHMLEGTVEIAVPPPVASYMGNNSVTGSQ
uniref:Receptor-like serine/threonine-protein kinase n=1 Tax=Wollemia nobilis TaxID=56998 RepID=A0A0C9RJ83_9CONI